MNSSRHLLLRLSRTPTILYKNNHTTASSPNDFRLFTRTKSLSMQETAKAFANQLSSCSSLSQLSIFHAHLLRTRTLELYPVAFQWNNVIRSYTRLDCPFKAICVYIAMSRNGVLPDCYTIPIVLKAIVELCATSIGEQLHAASMKLGLNRHEFCESGFISLYCKAGDVAAARKVFEENPGRKLGSWNSIIGGLVQAGRSKEAIHSFIKMRKNGFEPDEVTVVSVISACGCLGNLNLALQLHKFVFHVKSDSEPDVRTMNSLIDMYGKCGRMDLARKVFSETPQKNVRSWTSMIVGYAMHGRPNEGLECFEAMRRCSVTPNRVTFIGVLSACVHGGLVQEGKRYFEMMRGEYKLEPELPHYGCMVDLLGRAGRLQEAKEVAESMPMEANAVVLGSLMGASEKHMDVGTAEWVAERLVRLEPWNDGVYVVLSNVYANNGLWGEVERLRGIMKRRQLAKVPGFSLASSNSSI